jgi:hypothetical protein
MHFLSHVLVPSKHNATQLTKVVNIEKWLNNHAESCTHLYLHAEGSIKSTPQTSEPHRPD